MRLCSLCSVCSVGWLGGCFWFRFAWLGVVLRLLLSFLVLTGSLKGHGGNEDGTVTAGPRILPACDRSTRNLGSAPRRHTPFFSMLYVK